MRSAKTLVLGIGSDYRGDDAVGLYVAREVHAVRPPGVEILEDTGDIATLIEEWSHYELVIIVDATSSGAPPGTIVRFEPLARPLPSVFIPHVSSHGMGVPEAVELARALDRLPHRLVVWGIEGETFDTTIGLSPPVTTAVDMVASEILQEIAAAS